MATEDEKREVERIALEVATTVEQHVGHPDVKWQALIASVEGSAIHRFSDVSAAWLDLMWCLDSYRQANVPPRGVGKPANSPDRRLEAYYKGKGNWFADLLAALLGQQTSQYLAPRAQVEGFSQDHQIDVAWPARKQDVLICAETKVTGAPPCGDTGERGAVADYTNRRKEIKFAATDLKLGHREQREEIRNWRSWRSHATPQTYFLWAARLATGRVNPNTQRLAGRDRIETLTREAKALVDTYIDGAGLFAWQLNAAGTAYEEVPLPKTERVTSLDEMLDYIASEINRMAKTAEGQVSSADPVAGLGQLAQDGV